jgi:hypothetical protein
MSAWRFRTTSKHPEYPFGLTPEEVLARGVATVDVCNGAGKRDGVIIETWASYQEFIHDRLALGYYYT